MIYASKIESIITDLSYREIGTYKVHSKIFWNDRNQKCIVLINGTYANIKTESELDDLLKKIQKNYNIAKTDRLLTVLLGENTQFRLVTTDIIAIGQTNAKLYNVGENENFHKEIEAFRVYCNDQKHIQKRALGKKFGIGGEKAPACCAVICLMIVIFAITYPANIAEYGISVAQSVLSKNHESHLFSYMFVHAGFLHLISNAVTLAVIGGIFERRSGSLDFLVVYYFGGVIGGGISLFLQYIMYGIGDKVTVGASGSICAVAGAMTVNIIISKDIISSDRKKEILFLSIFLILSSIGERTDYLCHVGGYVSGWELYVILRELKKYRHIKKYGIDMD